MKFSEKVKAFMKQGDSAKLDKFAKKVVKLLNDAIKEEEEIISKLTEKLEEAKENKVDIFLTVDLESVKDVDTRDNYAVAYVNELLSYDTNELTPLQDEIEEAKQHIEDCNAVLKFFEEMEPKIEKEQW